MSPPPQRIDQVFELKGSRFSLSVLQLQSTDLTALSQQLADTIAQAPKLLQQAPIVLELAAGLNSCLLDLPALQATLRELGVILVGLRGGDEDLRRRATGVGIALWADTRATNPVSNTAPPNITPFPEPLVIDKTVRSGQQIYAQNCDLVIMGSVSVGAEVIADGHIHVYGTLRGRALAGARGQETGRIFSQSLQPELLSIAGCYRLFEEADGMDAGRPAQAFLRDDRLIVEPL